MKLYYASDTCALAVNIVLEWLDISCETEQIELGDPKFLSINPLGTVPVLVDDEVFIDQVDAILKYLVSKHPESNLAGDSPATDSEINRWLAFITGDLHPAYYAVFRPFRYTTSEAENDREAVKDASNILVDKYLSHLNNHMQNKDYIALNKRTIADAYAYALVRWSYPLEQYPELKHFIDKMSDDRGVRAALATHGIE